MPIYEYRCQNCKGIVEAIQTIGAGSPMCCGLQMTMMPTYPAMIKMKGEGGYPSRRKFVKGTAPNTTRSSKAWLDEDPYESTRKAQHGWV